MNITVPEIRTLITYTEGEKKASKVVDFIGDYNLEQVEIDKIIQDECPFDLPYFNTSFEYDGANKVIMFVYGELRGLSLKVERTVYAELTHVLEYHGKYFKLEELNIN